MKTVIKNTLAAAGLTIVILACVGTLFGARALFISSVFQSLAVNLIIQLGLKIIRKAESSYFILETLMNIGFVMLVIIPAGFLFEWYGTGTPLWIVVLMGTIVYGLGCAVDIMLVNKDIQFINQELKIRNDRKEVM